MTINPLDFNDQEECEYALLVKEADLAEQAAYELGFNTALAWLGLINHQQDDHVFAFEAHQSALMIKAAFKQLDYAFSAEEH